MRVYVGIGKVRNKNTIITQKNLILCFYLNEVSVTLTTRVSSLCPGLYVPLWIELM